MTNYPNKKVAAIVPALNEEANVENVLKVILDSKFFGEVVLVDDGSTDKTAEIGEKLGAKVLRLQKIGGSGKGNAMEQGIKNTDAEIIVFFDADLVGLTKEHILLLANPMLKENIEMCVGIRGRLWGLPKLIAKIDPLLAIGGERAIKKDLFEKIPEKLLQGFAVETALDYYCLAEKLPVKYVMLENLDAVAKEKKYGFLKGFSARIKMIFEIIKIRLLILFHKNELI